jgi:DNA-binding transcriptional MocR family regulator
MEQSNAIEVFLRAEILRLGPGNRLVGVRQLQNQFRASPTTIQRILRRLVGEGLIVTRPGDGSYVASKGIGVASDYSWQSSVLGRAPFVPGGLDHLTVESSPGVLALDGGFPDVSLQAHGLLQRATTRACRRPDAWDRCLPEGTLALRSKFAAELGPDFTAADVIVTPGVQSAIDSVFRSFARPGESILIEEPSYPGAIAAATFAGLNVVPIPTDQYGMRTDLVENAIERTGARLAFVQPRYANPTGSVLSVERRMQLLEIAHQRSMFVLEDDWVRDLDLGTKSPPPLIHQDAHGHVLYLRSLSKTTAPGMRIGAVVARGPASARLRAVRVITDFFATPLLQATVVELFEDRGWERHLQHMRTELRVRRDVLVRELGQRVPELTFVVPEGGVALWVKLPPTLNESAFVSECRSRGLRIGSGRAYWLSEPPSGYVRVSFASTNPAGLQEAALRISDSAASVNEQKGNGHSPNLR